MEDGQVLTRLGRALFLLFLTISCILAFIQKPRQFQELDSFFVIEMMREPAQTALGYLGPSYQIGGRNPAPAPGRAEKWVRGAPDWYVTSVAPQPLFIDEQGGGDTRPVAATGDVAQLRASLTDRVGRDPRLRSLPPHGVYRFAEIAMVNAAPLPHWLKAGLIFPLGTTYSLAPGLLYSLVYAADPDHRAFLQNATTLTIIVFHLSALLLFAAMRRFGVGSFAACATALWYLLATSLFGYGFHLGSTVWMMASSVVFLFAVASRKSVRWLSLCAALLIFFNYLIILYFGAWLLAQLVREARQGNASLSLVRRLWTTGLELLRQCWIGLGIILVFAAIFLQPGQGTRGSMRAIEELPVYIVYWFANLMGIAGNVWSSLSTPLIVIEASVIATILLGSGFALFRRMRAAPYGDGTRDAGALLSALAVSYAGFCILGLLNFAPTRQSLFLAPALFLLASFGFDALFRRLPGRTMPVAPIALIIVTAIAGFGVQQVRYAATTELRPPLDRARYQAALGNALPYILDTGLPIVGRWDARSVAGPILYADSDCDYACLTRRLRADPHIGRQRIVAAKPVASLGSDIRPIAFPAPDDGRFAYDRRNHLYLIALWTDAAAAPPAGF